MIISRTPFRISLFGGGTDYPDWIREHGGAVLGMAINKYCYLSVRSLPPFFTHTHRLVYSRIELVREIAEIQHPSFRAVFSEMGVDKGLEIHNDADLPARSGLGSSSAFTVGLLNSLNVMQGRQLSKVELAAEAIRIEQKVIGEPVGCQDQVWAAHGGFNRIDFAPDGGIAVRGLDLPSERRDELVQSMILVFSGLSRFSADVAELQVRNLTRNESPLMAIRAMVDEAERVLADGREPIWRIGELLNETWRMKRGLADTVSNQTVDEIYSAAMAAGASGGKLLGAGGGGFMVFIAPPERRKSVLEALRGLIHVTFDIDHDGSRIMVNAPDDIGRLDPSPQPAVPPAQPIEMTASPAKAP